MSAYKKAQKITGAQLAPTLPKSYRNAATDELVDIVNTLAEDPDYGEHFKDSFLTYTSVLEGKENFSMDNYLNAVKFFSLTSVGMPAVRAYCKVFPERLQKRLDRGESIKDMGGEGSRFNNSELVNKIRAQALVPLHLLNQDKVQLAINTLANIMIGGRSEVARVSAATTLIKELRPPEVQQVEMQIGMSDQVLEAQNKQTEQLITIAENQKRLLEAGASIEDVQAININVVDVHEEEDEDE